LAIPQAVFVEVSPDFISLTEVRQDLRRFWGFKLNVEAIRESPLHWVEILKGVRASCSLGQ
jgi:hypothetical protein